MTVPSGAVSPKVRDSAIARKFVSQNGRAYLALGIYGTDGEPVDADAGTVQLKVYYDDLATTQSDPRGLLVVNVVEATGIVRDEVGKYHFDLSPEYTRQRGVMTAEWTYTVDGVDLMFTDYLQVLEQMPVYDRLRPEAKVIIEQVSWFFGDLFDSTAGGPWLQENYQTHFSYERIAQLSSQAIMKINLLGYPITNFGVSVDDPKIPKNFSSLTVWATKLECIRHLALSYTEQPDFRNMQTTYSDRRDYSQRWQAILEEEKPDFQKAVTLAKRDLLKLGRGSLLVAGGIYSSGARGFFVSGLYAAQTRSMRFYPAAPSVSWGAQATGGAW